MLGGRLRNRRAFLGLGAGLGLVVLGTPLYMRRFEPFWLRLRRYSVALPWRASFGPLRVLHLSDFHFSDVVPLEYLRRAVRLGLSCDPDLICVTGDFITTDIPSRADYAEVLRELGERAPTYACLGNHDGGLWSGRHGATLQSDEMCEFLTQAGIHCLRNQSALAPVRGTQVTLVGLGDLWAGDTDAEKAFQGVDCAAGPCLVLCHNPDAKERLAARRWDLLLCGHTHGGQLRLPLLGTPFAPVRDHRYVVGLHEWSGRMLHVSAGVGNLHGLRLNCPPDIALLTLTGTPQRGEPMHS
jgi:predicted MPP superfamily phosphohydrolase